MLHLFRWGGGETTEEESDIKEPVFYHPMSHALNDELLHMVAPGAFIRKFCSGRVQRLLGLFSFRGPASLSPLDGGFSMCRLRTTLARPTDYRDAMAPRVPRLCPMLLPPTSSPNLCPQLVSAVLFQFGV